MKKKIEEAVSKFDLRGDDEEGRNRLRDIAIEIGYSKGKNIHLASSLDRAKSFQIKKIPTGIFNLDWYLHGGIPIGRVTRFYGKRNSCKTTTMLKILSNAQRFCRYCQEPITLRPEGHNDCSCPNPRWKMADENLLQRLDSASAQEILDGRLPKGASINKPEISLDGKKIHFEETYRCSPMRSVFVETEHKLDEKWVRVNGVDPRLVMVIGSDWAESTIDVVEKVLYTGEVDIIFLDTISMLVPRDTIEKSMDDKAKVANKAQITQRFMSKVVASQFRHGVLGECPITMVACTQVRTLGIGSWKGSYLGVSDGNMMDHIVSLDIKMAEKGYKYTHKEHVSYGLYEFNIVKNHCGGSSGVSGNFKLWLDQDDPTYKVGDTDDLGLIVKHSRKLEYVASSGSKYLYKSPYSESTFNSLAEFEKFLQTNSAEYVYLRKKVMDGLEKVRTEMKGKKGEGTSGEPSKNDEEDSSALEES